MDIVTHGTEQEIQVVNPSGELERRVTDLMNCVPKSLSGQFERKFIKDAYFTQLEIVTGVAEDIDELRSELIFLRMLGHEAAETHGLEIIATGANPICVTRPGENFGEHHHVGARNAKEKVHIHNYIREFTPELMALTVNSPIYKPENEFRYESYRASRNPHIRYTPRIDYDKYVNGDSLQFLKDRRYLDVTPFVKNNIPTVETRLFDTQITLAMSVAIGAILNAITLRARKYIVEDRIPPRVAPGLLQNNRMEAAKNGIRAVFSSDPTLRYAMNFMYHIQGDDHERSVPAFKAAEMMMIYLEDELEEMGISWKTDRLMAPLRDTIKYKCTQADFQLKIYEEKGYDGLMKDLIMWTKKGSRCKDIKRG